MKNFFAFTLLVMPFFLLFCQSHSMGKTNAPAVEHYIKYSNKGSKSEARSGYLKVNGFIVPDNFLTVVAGGEVYHFYMRKYMWGNDGYFPDKDSKVEQVCPATDLLLSDDDLARGWTIVKGRPSNAPLKWIYVIWKNGSAVVAPERLEDFVLKNNIPSLPRSLMFEKLIN
jgi:hypothetical protein